MELRERVTSRSVGRQGWLVIDGCLLFWWLVDRRVSKVRGRGRGGSGPCCAFGRLVHAEFGEQAGAERAEGRIAPQAGAVEVDREVERDRRPSVRTSTRSASRIASSTSWVTSTTAGWWRWQSSHDERVHADAGERIEGAEWLVEQQQFGLAHEGAGQRDPLGLAA